MKSDGGIGSTYNVMPKLFVRLHAAFQAGDTKLAMELQEQINQVRRKCTSMLAVMLLPFNDDWLSCRLKDACVVWVVCACGPGELRGILVFMS
jgi:hypothetical protein